MPLYEFRCSAGHVQETFERAVTLKRSIACEVCGKRAVRVVSLPARPFQPHFNEGAGEYFESPEDKRRKLRAKGLEEAGGTGVRDKRGRIYSYAGQANRGGNALPQLN